MPNESEINCPECNGAQFVLRKARPTDRDVVFSEHGPAVLAPCPLCNGIDKRREYLARLSGLNDTERSYTFGQYWENVYGTKAITAVKQVLQQNGWVTLIGGYGCGKTFLLMATVNEAIKQNRLAVYIGMEQLLDHLRSAFRTDAEVEYDKLFETVTNADVLCLDEIEKYNPTPWAESRLYELIDKRYRNYTSQTTVLATNSLEDCPGYLKSRILDGRFTVIKLQVPDVRPNIGRNINSERRDTFNAETGRRFGAL